MSKLEGITSKIFLLPDLIIEIRKWKSDKKKLVFTNGCFDLLHRGHIEYLAQTADFGDKLIVAVNADSSVKMLNKGDSRPLQDEYSRALLIASLSFVDAVVLFEEKTPLNVISKIVPEVLVKGGDYDASVSDKTNKKYIVGSDIVKSKGGIVEVIDFIEGFSTTKIEEKIKG